MKSKRERFASPRVWAQSKKVFRKKSLNAWSERPSSLNILQLWSFPIDQNEGGDQLPNILLLFCYLVPFQLRSSILLDSGRTYCVSNKARRRSQSLWALIQWTRIWLSLCFLFGTATLFIVRISSMMNRYSIVFHFSYLSTLFNSSCVTYNNINM